LRPVISEISKQLLVEKLESDLKDHQEKYDYHTRISLCYLEIIEETRMHLEEVYSNAS